MEFFLAKESLVDLPVDLAVLGCFESETAAKISKDDDGSLVDKAFNGKLQQVLVDEKFTGKLSKCKLVPSFGAIKAKQVLLIGLGEKKNFNIEAARKVGIALAKKAAEVSASSAALVIQKDNLNGIAPAQRLQAIAEGVQMGAYRFQTYKSEQQAHPLKEITFLSSLQNQTMQAALLAGQAIGEAVCFARDLGNLPSNDLTPKIFAKYAEQVAKDGNLECKVYGPDFMKKQNMRLFLAVSQGAEEEPRLIHLRYKPAGKAKAHVALVGKGITFDTGGISLKPPKDMGEMKSDMCGAANMLATMQVIAATKPDVMVDTYLACSENMPDGKAYKPGDIIKARNGKTVEIISTDAEGRLVLADTLDYVIESKPDYLIDMATLTGGCLYAVGEMYTALISNNSAFANKLLKSASNVHEYFWQLPFEKRYLDSITKGPADLQNSGGSRAQTATAAMFLSQFVGDTKWIHLDIASSSWSNSETDIFPQYSTGATIPTLVDFLHSF